MAYMGSQTAKHFYICLRFGDFIDENIRLASNYLGVYLSEFIFLRLSIAPSRLVLVELSSKSSLFKFEYWAI